MEGVWDLQKKIFKYTIGFMAILSILGLIFINNPKAFVYGLVFGTLISMLNFRALALTLQKAVKMAPHKAQIYTASRYFLRFIINGIVIYVSIKADYINVLGTIIGLILIKIVILLTNLINDKSFLKKILKKSSY